VLSGCVVIHLIDAPAAPTCTDLKVEFFRIVTGGRLELGNSSDTQVYASDHDQATVPGVKAGFKRYCNQTARKKAAGWLVKGMGKRLNPPVVMVFVLTGTQLPLFSEVLISMR
jgi:hypothetical protein